MKKSKFTEEQIAFALKQAETGTPVKEVVRKMGITETTFYRWKRKYGGLGTMELRRLKQLEEENRKLKSMVADLSLDKAMLQEVISKNSEVREEALARSIPGRPVSSKRAPSRPGDRDRAPPREWRGSSALSNRAPAAKPTLPEISRRTRRIESSEANPSRLPPRRSSAGPLFCGIGTPSPVNSSRQEGLPATPSHHILPELRAALE